MSAFDDVEAEVNRERDQDYTDAARVPEEDQPVLPMQVDR